MNPTRIRGAFLLCLATMGAGFAQTVQSWDGSGNGLLNGTYAFRSVWWTIGTQRGDLQEAVTFYGTFAFDGAGNYTMTCRFVDGGAGTTGNCSNAPIPGTYKAASNGFVR